MGLSIAPGFTYKRKRLLSLLLQAAELSGVLKVVVDGRPVEIELRSVALRLEEVLAYQADKR